MTTECNWQTASGWQSITAH